MANYECPLQKHIDALQATADMFKADKLAQLYNKQWKIYYYKPNSPFSAVAVNPDCQRDFSKLNYTAYILQAIENDLEEEDFVVF